MDSPDRVLALDHAGRRLAGRWAVRGLGLEVARGEVLGLLGVNGAGKSTTLRMIAGVLAPSTGAVRIDGEDLYEDPALARRRKEEKQAGAQDPSCRETAAAAEAARQALMLHAGASLAIRLLNAYLQPRIRAFPAARTLRRPSLIRR